MKIFYQFIFVLISTSVFSQINDVNSFGRLHTQHNNYKTVIGFNADVYTGSNSINNNFINAFLLNKYIDNDLKKSVILKDNNYYGNQNQANLYYSHLYDTLMGVANMGIKVAANSYISQNIKFSEDIFNLVMYGNKMYEEKTANFSGFDFNLLKYQSLEIGFFKRIKEPANGYHTAYLGLNLIKGQDYHYMFLNNASLYTAAQGEYLDIELNGAYFGSDSVKTDFTSVTGLGASVNFYWAYEDVKRNARFEVSFTQLGLISWYENPLNYSTDTIIRFEGAEIRDVFNVTENSTSNISKDTVIDNIFETKDNTTFNKSLPKQFNFAYTKILLDNKYYATVGAGYIFNANQMMPVLYLNNKYYLSPSFNLSVLMSYGGYTKYRLGLGTEFTLKKHFNMIIGTTNVVGFIMPNKTYSQALYLSLGYSF